MLAMLIIMTLLVGMFIGSLGLFAGFVYSAERDVRKKEAVERHPAGKGRDDIMAIVHAVQ